MSGHSDAIAADRLADGLDAATVDLLVRMPKAELHLHLDGSLRRATAVELLAERPAVAEALGLPRRADADTLRSRLVAPERCADQAELLRAFDLPIALLQDREALERIAAELVEDVAADGTCYAEVRWAPALHVAGGLSLGEVIAAVAAGARRGMAAAPGCEVRLIAVALRSHPPETSRAVAEAAVAAAGAELVVGFDLAGREADFPDPLLHGDAFEIARAGGLGITVHAGEWGGPAQVRRGLAVKPARIAHGAPAADDPSLVADLIARGVTLDLCPTSNLQAGLVERLSDHPLPRLVRAGVPVTLSTDDRTVSDLTLVREYARAHTTLGLSLAELWRLDRHALEVAFLARDEPLRARLRQAFDAFAAEAPVVLA
ncbi:MAG TPA: adenosine deaminase [Candidatus Limnocylindrales bacterium]|nr:adenosine deaminase [Candidatus Limnocylindrales bacterium]